MQNKKTTKDEKETAGSCPPAMTGYVFFNACKYLDFSDKYTAKKTLISLGGTAKVCWDRPVFDESYP